jgi:transposase
MMMEERRQFTGAEETPERSGGGDAAPVGRERWSARRKGEAVLRVLRGESMEELSREFGAPLHELQEWRDRFVAEGMAALRSRQTSAAEVELAKARQKIGELMMEIELHEKKGALLAARRRRSEP